MAKISNLGDSSSTQTRAVSTPSRISNLGDTNSTTVGTSASSGTVSRTLAADVELGMVLGARSGESGYRPFDATDPHMKPEYVALTAGLSGEAISVAKSGDFATLRGTFTPFGQPLYADPATPGQVTGSPPSVSGNLVWIITHQGSLAGSVSGVFDPEFFGEI